MQVKDRRGRSWKITIDEEEKLYFYNREKPALEYKIAYPASGLAEFYDMERERGNEFLSSLGQRIGLPLWPLFVERSMEKEFELVSSLGVLGPVENGDFDTEYWSFIVPEPRESALQKRPELEPSAEELEEHEKRLKALEAHVQENGIAAVCFYISEDKEKTVRDMDGATDLIQICAVCSRPAELVGIYRESEDSRRLILHGMCPGCAPGDCPDPDKTEKMQAAVAELLSAGRVKMWTKQGESL